jgi:aryl-alcohol dehydrogenase-like predicted oxidoreductase
MTFGEQWGWGSSKEESRGIYDRFRDLGGNFVDTANLYTNGTSELFLGEFMEGHRDQIVLRALRSVAKESGHSPAQIALAWLRHRESPVIPIIGARRLDQLESNTAIVDLKPAAEEIRALDEASQIELGFPHDSLDKPTVKAFTFGGTRDLIDA